MTLQNRGEEEGPGSLSDFTLIATIVETRQAARVLKG